METISVAAIGWRAHAALARSGGAASALGAPSGYLEADGEIVWLGVAGDALHGRAVLADQLPLGHGEVTLALGVAGIWRPGALGESPPAEALAAAGERLRASLHEVGEPRGLGTLLAGRTPEFPLDTAAPAARALAWACAAGDAAAAVAAAAALIGLGPGLTPSGDDFVGGAFFVRALLAPPPGEAWERAADAVRVLAHARTHPVSATLLGDLIAGEGWAPLHDLARAVATGDVATAIAAARGLTRIGHSSGWDLLAGFLAALTGGRGL